jgi:hypothetical protein
MPEEEIQAKAVQSVQDAKKAAVAMGRLIQMLGKKGTHDEDLQRVHS